MAENDHARTLEATPYRRQRARTRGQVPQSQDLSSSVVLIVGILAMSSLGGGLITAMGTIAQEQLGGHAWLSADVDSTVQLWSKLGTMIGGALAPMLAVLFIAAIAVNISQTGFMFLPERLSPDAARLDPMQGVARVFSVRGFSRIAFGIVKLLVIGAVMWSAVAGKEATFASLGMLSLPQIAAFLLDLMFWTSLKLAGALVALGVADYALQRWHHERSLRMTPQELREELKDAEGDPLLAARRKKVQRERIAERAKR